MSRLSLLLTLTLACAAPSAPAAEVPSFTNEVVPILTRFGCNQGACHGKAAGQNGFRLSLRGYAPEQDHEWLTREYGARRLNLPDPPASPLLRKATGQSAHEGGKLFAKDHRAHATLLAWIKAGAPGPKSGEATLQKLHLVPDRVVLKPGDSKSLKVEATFSDGRVRDVTWLAKFDSGDAGMAEVSPAGVVRARRHGEAAVRASFQGQVAVLIVTSPNDRPVNPKRLAPRNNFIDDHVYEKLSALRIDPSDLCTDAEFLRRTYLDTLGVLPTPTEVRAFLTDTRADRRRRLIDHLLDRPELNDHWALFLGDLLQNRKERDHDVRGTKGVRAFHAWLHRQVRARRGWDQIARDVLLASGNTADSPAVGYYIVILAGHSEPERSEVADSVAQAFLGTRIGCARCHNHPSEKYTQDDFYHFAAFFSRVRMDRKDPQNGPTVLRLAGGTREPHLAKAKVGVTQPRTGQFLPPRPLDRSAVKEIMPGEDPRLPLVNWITSPKNEYFSGAMVNRVWRHFMGVGLVEPVDDLRASNPPSNPALWAALNKDFVEHKFDLRRLMRVILESRAYQLSSATRPGNVTDTRFYSHHYARPLPAEVLLDAISAATGVPDRFPGYPLGTRAGQLPDPGVKSYFLSLFGKSERVTACACERGGEVTLPQLLHLQNGTSVVDKVRSMDGRLVHLITREKKSDEAIIEELFLATFSRFPTEKEKAAARQALASGEKRGDVFQDLFWALLNSKSFVFNR